ncbi:hypothetical protein JHD46_08590 [Sulfurimonas sp. SAG-AH-194-C20]|nr:hypothetical protein [Sulfurimonas sp. SAG-AH-194-C20]MDF1879693.1 hypothetical protein [Sulfurimonas sp. SAG-AH-194-C20]
MPYEIKIQRMTRVLYHECVDLAFLTLRADRPSGYKRQDAVDFLIKDKENKIRVITYNGSVVGMYLYKENANNFSLGLFALSPSVRKSRAGYKLYLDMKDTLIGKPVLFATYGDNSSMKTLARKRSMFLGASPSAGGKSIEYYSLFFGDKKIWKGEE